MQHTKTNTKLSRQELEQALKKQAEKYEATETDLTWAREMIATLKDGGNLAHPTSGLLYQVFHERKELVLKDVKRLGEFDALLVHLKTIAVFRKLGWQVIEQAVAVAFTEEEIRADLRAAGTPQAVEDVFISLWKEGIVAPVKRDADGIVYTSLPAGAATAGK